MNISYVNSTVNPEDEQLWLISIRLIISMQVLNFFIGIPLHIHVIILLTRAGGLDESVFFSVSQSAMEILFALSAPLYVLCSTSLCFDIPLTFFSGIGLIARSTFQCLVCVERYLAVVHPVTFLKFKQLKYRLFFLIVAWTYSLSYSITIIFVPGFGVMDFIVISYSIIVIVEIFCCVSILKVLRQPAPGKKEESGMSNTKKKAFRIVLINLLTHLIQMVPLVVAYIFKMTLSCYSWSGIASVTIAINIAAGLMVPFFYLHSADRVTFCPFCHFQK